MNDVIAIDFGTMRTKIAYHDAQRNSYELMRLGQDERPYIPSLFFLGEDGRRLFGDDAAEYLDSDPLAFLPKPLKRELREQWVRAGNRVKATPMELLSLLFAGLRDRTSEVACFRETAPTSVFLTVPAQYGPPDREVLAKAAHRAGFHEERIHFVDEPVAAAQAWLSELGGTEDYVVVLDCGGGTLDWACLHRSEGGRFELIPELPAGGDNRVGGFDIDESIFELIDDRITDVPSRENLQIRRCFIREQIRGLKERHSRTGTGGKVRVGNEPVEITSEVIDEVITRRFITQACQNLCSYLEKVRERLKIETPTVLLVGGSARLRGFKEAVAKHGQCSAVWWERSEYATVLGAIPSHSREDPPSSSTATLVHLRRQLDAKAGMFIAALRTRHEDFRYFLREALLVQWRLSNGVGASANRFADSLSSIQEGEDNTTKALKVWQGLNSVSIEAFDDIVRNCSSGFVQMVVKFIEDLPIPYTKLYSGLESYRAHFAPPAEWKRDFTEAVCDDLQSLRGEFNTIAGYYNQLREFYPRYLTMMGRPWWRDLLIGAGLGMTGGLGLAVAVVWGGWRGMNDEEFMRNYTAAIQGFIEGCVSFSQAGERALTRHIQKVNDIWDGAFKPMAEIYGALAQMNEDLEVIEKKSHELRCVSQLAEVEVYHRFVAAVVSNIREDSSASHRIVGNIVRELQRRGFAITDTGELDEKALEEAEIRTHRREGQFACPSCGIAPAVGPRWQCDQCSSKFDAFESLAVCPKCRRVFSETMCFTCGTAFPINDWKRNRLQVQLKSKDDYGVCPRGHGPLKTWNGTPRCWTCGFPNK